MLRDREDEMVQAEARVIAACRHELAWNRLPHQIAVELERLDLVIGRRADELARQRKSNAA